MPPVAWLVDSLRLGGAERLALTFAQEYQRRGGRVKIIALKAAPEPERALEAEASRLGLDWVCLGARHLRDWAAWRGLRRHLRQFQPAVLHAHLRYATLWGALAAWRQRRPLVVTLHVLPLAGHGRWRQLALAWLERWALNHVARRVLLLGAAQAQAWRQAGLDPRRQRLLPNGISLPLPAPEAGRRVRAELGIPDAAPVFLTVAAVRENKGWRDWLAVQAAVRLQFPQARFIWLGAGPQLAELRRKALDQNGVFLPGLRMNVADWLAAADVFLFPSHQEAMPTALAEALLAGVPAAAYDLAANQEVAQGGGASGGAPPDGVGRPTARASVPAQTEGAGQQRVHWAPLGDRAALGAAACRAAGVGGASRRLAEGASTADWAGRLAGLYCEAAHDGRCERGRGGIVIVEFFSRGGLFHYSLQLAEAMARRGAAVTLLTSKELEVEPARIAGLIVEPVLPLWNPRQPTAGQWRTRLRRAIHGWQYARAWRAVLRWVKRRQPDWVLLGDLEHHCDAWGVAWLQHQGIRVADICHNPAMFDRRLWRSSGSHGRLGRPAPVPPRASTPMFATSKAGAQSKVAEKRRHPLTREVRWRREMLRRLDMIFVHAPALADQIAATAGRRATVIPHGNENLFLRVEAQGPPWRRRWGWPAAQPVGLLFGTLTRYKGIPTLLAAMGALPAAARPGLVIAGFPAADAEPSAWRMEANRLALDPWLRWELGYIPVDQVAGLMRAVDFLVLPYWEASQSGVAHLAFTFSLPVIATDCGGLSAVIRDGENGLLVPPRDTSSLASALARMSASRALRDRLAKATAAGQPDREWDSIAKKVLCHLPKVAQMPALHASGRLGTHGVEASAGGGQPEEDHLERQHQADDTRKPRTGDDKNDHRLPRTRRVLE